jgi:hypothetical protein
MLSAPVEIEETRITIAESSYLISDIKPRSSVTRQTIKRLFVFLIAFGFFAFSFIAHDFRSFDEIYDSNASNYTNSTYRKLVIHTKF